MKVHGNQIPPDFQPKMLLEQLYDVLERAKWMNKNVHVSTLSVANTDSSELGT